MPRETAYTGHMTTSLRGPTAFTGMIVFVVGAVLWMVSERPDFHTDQGVSPTGQTIAVLGQGGTGIGAAWLGYRAAQSVRERDDADRQPVVETFGKGRPTPPPSIAREVGADPEVGGG